MAIGARDHIDQMLVKKYENEKVDNHDMAASAVPPEKMLEVMQDYAAVQRNMLNLQTRLNSICKGLNTRAAYVSIK